MDENIASTLLIIKRGDSKTYGLEFTDKYDSPENITGWEVVFTVKIKIDAPDSDAIIQKIITSHIDPTNGKTKIILSSLDTNPVGNFIFDVQVKTDLGEIKTVLEGDVSITQDITQRS